MAVPTVDSRLRRRCIVMTDDANLLAGLYPQVPEGWTLIAASDLAQVGGFEDVLQMRFILLDLDAKAFDPSDVIEQVRREMMLNVAIFCFGGTVAAREEARQARADRFFERAEVAQKLAAFCEQFGW